MALPEWKDHHGHKKLVPLAGPGTPQPDVEAFLAATAERQGRDRSDFRVLDIGCGRGSMVARLMSLGWNAWGADVSSDYIEAGTEYFSQIGDGSARIGLIGANGIPFDEPFDAIVSTETLEHVEDLHLFASGLDAVSKPGTVGMHRWPAKYRVKETHMYLPGVHWLPKGGARKAMIRAQLGMGMGADYFSELPLPDRAEIFNRYSTDEPFYRTLRDVREIFGAHGMDCENLSLPMKRFKEKVPSAPSFVGRIAAIGYSQFHAVQMTTIHR